MMGVVEGEEGEVGTPGPERSFYPDCPTIRGERLTMNSSLRRHGHIETRHDTLDSDLTVETRRLKFQQTWARIRKSSFKIHSTLAY